MVTYMNTTTNTPAPSALYRLVAETIAAGGISFSEAREEVRLGYLPADAAALLQSFIEAENARLVAKWEALEG